MSGDHYISLDVGATAVKTVLFDRRGDIVAAASREYPLQTPSEDVVECDAHLYWLLCKEGIAAVLADSHVPARQVKSIGVCSQGETLIAVDRHGRPLRKAILSMDNRSREEAQEIEKALGRGQITGQLRPQATWPITKILWLKRHEPRTFRRAFKFLLVEDYVLHGLMGGRFRGEYSLYSSSFMLDIAAKTWWQDILDFVGVSPERLASLGEPGQIVGHLSRTASRETGLPSDTAVVAGGLDHAAAILASGAMQPGVVTEMTGSGLAVGTTVDLVPQFCEDLPIAVQCHVIPGKYLLIGWCPTGGMGLKWLSELCLTPQRDGASHNGHGSDPGITRLAEPIPPGSQGLICLPYMAGRGTADVSDVAGGVYFGLGLHHGRGHLVRSLLEAVGFILRQNISLLARAGFCCREICSVGTGSRSQLWNQIKANIAGKPVVTITCPEAPALGTAILQARAVGTYRSLEAATSGMVHRAARIEPNDSDARTYDLLYDHFLRIEEHIYTG